MRYTPLIAAALALLAGPAARADTVEVSSTTLISAGQQTRDGSSGGKPELVTTVPAYEILSISARDIRTPIADDLQLVMSGWGSYDFDHRRWDNGTDSSLTGDLVTGYVQGRVINRALTLRLGRAHMMTGVARMIQLDGGEAILVLPRGFRISGYAGSPVAQRFASRSGLRSWNPTGGNFAYGGRLSWALALPGPAGNGLEVGASANVVRDSGDFVRQEVGADFRLQPLANVSFTGFGAYSVYDERYSEAKLMGRWTPLRRLQLTADWHFVAPDLLLARNSILSVFSASSRNEYGGGVSYELLHGLTAGVDAHLQLEPGERPGEDTYTGADAAARLDWSRGATDAGAELLWLRTFENGYVAGRLYGKQTYGKLFAAADVLAHFFREAVNGQDYAVTGTLSIGAELMRGFSAVVAGRAGVTPYMEQTYDIMAKLAYNQTYRTREVR
jgi:hypothetical protein